VFVTASRCDTSRLYVIEKGGLIRLVKGAAISTFLDVTSVVKSDGLSEGGLLGLAFHPDYDTNGRFWIHYSALPTGRTKVVEYKRSAADADKADPAPVRTLVDAQQQGDQHVGGTVAFGRDGKLYASFGDFGTGANAQSTQSVHGKILRFDVDQPPATPLDSGGSVAPYIFALGLRNPYRFAFDRANGDMFIGDVGEATYEEINVGPALEAGRNYGWPTFEGPCDPCNGTIAPVKAHTRVDNETGARSIIGGNIYRGKGIPCLYGFYVYGDYNYEPRAWAMRWDGAGGTVGPVISIQKDLFQGMTPQPSLVAFGEDAAGEIYVTDANGKIFRIDAE
jgi:glucose/arabinose dehydrogenase